MRVHNLSLHLFFKQTEDYRCFNDLIDQDRFEEIEGSVLGDSLLFRVTRQSHAAQVVPSLPDWLSGIDRVPRTSRQAPEGQSRYSHQGFTAWVETHSPRTKSPGLAPGRSLGGYRVTGIGDGGGDGYHYAPHTEPVRSASPHTAPTLVSGALLDMATQLAYPIIGSRGREKTCRPGAER